MPEKWVPVYRTNSRKGQDNGRARLTEKDVRDIRAHILQNKTDRYLAALFGVSQDTIRDIRLGRTWKHVLQED